MWVSGDQLRREAKNPGLGHRMVNKKAAEKLARIRREAEAGKSRERGRKR
jgi:hypothetical protein